MGTTSVTASAEPEDSMGIVIDSHNNVNLFYFILRSKNMSHMFYITTYCFLINL